MQNFDFVIVGAGCAGLSLAYYLSQEPALSDRSILLIDQHPKDQNDRTWCFWHHSPSPFEKIISHQWSSIQVANHGFLKTFRLSEYKYSMIKGIDFYEFIFEVLDKSPNIEVRVEKATSFDFIDQKPCVRTPNAQYSCDWLFSSVSLEQAPTHKGYHYLCQHFKGWHIRTEQDTFDPSLAGFMDFRTPQQDQTRFFYTLPICPREALIEFTIFSESLLQDDDYDVAIKQYLDKVLGIDGYDVFGTEQGAIPMQDAPWSPPPIPNMIYIGTVGGDVKGSTGYAFDRIQRRMQYVVQSLASKRHPSRLRRSKRKYKIYDAALLHVLQSNLMAGNAVFQRLFERHPIERIFRFLDEESSLLEEIKIMHQMPHLPFLQAIGALIFKNL